MAKQESLVNHFILFLAFLPFFLLSYSKIRNIRCSSFKSGNYFFQCIIFINVTIYFFDNFSKFQNFFNKIKYFYNIFLI